MSGSQNQSLSTDSRAFEYVLGTLPVSERRDFEQAMEGNESLARAVRFWEEQLMAIQNQHASKAPDRDAWRRIEQRISARSAPEAESSSWRRWLPWSMVGALMLVLIIVLPQAFDEEKPITAPNSDYVAVLTDDRGQPRLTAITLSEGELLWLQWQDLNLQENRSAQLWAVSRRDGRTRPIAVFETADTQRLPLDQARRRLIADAEYLLLTEEEPGGSPLDEPSDQLLARGACVRLGTEKSS